LQKENIVAIIDPTDIAIHNGVKDSVYVKYPEEGQETEYSTSGSKIEAQNTEL